MSKDLGTYHLRVVFEDGSGYIQTWNTGNRYTGGSYDVHPLNAARIECNYESEKYLFECMRYMYQDGNYSCDCNRTLFVKYANGENVPNIMETSCGENIKLKSLTAIRPDGTEEQIYKK